MMTPVEEVMYGDLSRMRHVWRFSAQPVAMRENVAEHSFWTAIIAMTVAVELEQFMLVGEVATRAILHDVEETLTGDLVREMKYFDQGTRNAIAAVEAKFAKRLFSSLGDQVGSFFNLVWLQAKDDTLAGHIVALADLLCVLSYLDHEQALGNQSKQLWQIDKDCRQLIQDKFGNDENEGLKAIAARFKPSEVTSTIRTAWRT